MRKILLIVLLILTANIPAQENYKGRISLTFNDEKIDLPINSVMIRKEDQIIISVRADRNNDSLLQNVALEFSFKKLTKESGGQTIDNLGMTISNHNKATSLGGEVTFSFATRNERANFSISRKGERVSWEINSLSLELNINEIIYVDSQFKIIGEFAGEFKSIDEKGETRKEVAKIKDGKFEIVI